jgi:Holliday junction resolvase RusA-like endonuclease
LPKARIIWIPGKPVPKGRPRFYKGHALTPKATHDYEKRIKLEWVKQYGFDLIEDAEITVHVEARSKTAGRCDVDNYLKIALDGLQGAAFPNDNKVVEAKVRKFKVDTPDKEGMRILVLTDVLES